MYCIIMAGGSGTRFWPRSKVAHPKQFLNITGNYSLIQDTYNRFNSFISGEHTFVVSNQSQKEILIDQKLDIPDTNYIYEPVGKNTLPCIGLAALHVAQNDPEEVMVITPSDHLIKNIERFKDIILEAEYTAQSQNGFVTVGIQPTFPATGYGYIKIWKENSRGSSVKSFTVNRFVEKPDRQCATNYVDSGEYFWNSGIFVFKASVVLDAIQNYQPEMYRALNKIQKHIGQPNYDAVLNQVYRTIDGISIDYGIMEKVDNVFMVKGDFEWNDLGSWEQVYQIENKDENNNAVIGDAILVNSKNSYVFSDNGVVGLVGLDDVVVVQDGNTTLVCKRDSAEDVKKVVHELKSQKFVQYL